MKKIIPIKNKEAFEEEYEIVQYELNSSGVGRVELKDIGVFTVDNDNYPKFFVVDPMNDPRSIVADWCEIPQKEAIEIYEEEFIALVKAMASLKNDALIAGIDLDNYYFPVESPTLEGLEELFGISIEEGEKQDD